MPFRRTGLGIGRFDPSLAWASAGRPGRVGRPLATVCLFDSRIQPTRDSVLPALGLPQDAVGLGEGQTGRGLPFLFEPLLYSGSRPLGTRFGGPFFGR